VSGVTIYDIAVERRKACEAADQMDAGEGYSIFPGQVLNQTVSVSISADSLSRASPVNTMVSGIRILSCIRYSYGKNTGHTATSIDLLPENLAQRGFGLTPSYIPAWEISAFGDAQFRPIRRAASAAHVMERTLLHRLA
jgi:hypothetical protein